MRDPLLNDLRGFDISCTGEDATRAEALCAAVGSLLENSFGKPVVIGPLHDAAAPRAMFNRVWIDFSLTAENDTLRLGAKWGSSMAMKGLSPVTEGASVELDADSDAAEQAEAVLATTPFGKR